MNEFLELSTQDGTKFLVDIQDVAKIFNYSWFIFKNKSKTYVRGYDKTLKKKIFLHRLIMDVDNLKCQIDHINGNTLDNRKCNLRICNNSENQMNRKTNKNNTSGFKGVYSNNSKKYPWKAVIGANSKRIYLGQFKIKEDAATAYNEAAVKLHGFFAKLNIL